MCHYQPAAWHKEGSSSTAVQQKKAGEGSGYMAFLPGLFLVQIISVTAGEFTFQPQLTRLQLVSIDSYLKVLMPSSLLN